MPSSYSFDVVSDFDRQELVNAINQTEREVAQRYDLKDSDTEIFPDAIGLSFVRLTFLSRSLSTISLKIHPAPFSSTKSKLYIINKI